MTSLNLITQILVILIPLIILYLIARLSKTRDYDRIRKRNYRRFSYLLTVVLISAHVGIWILNQNETNKIKLKNENLAELNETILKENQQLKSDRKELHSNSLELTENNLSISEQNENLSSEIAGLKYQLYQKENKISNLENQVKNREISSLDFNN